MPVDAGWQRGLSRANVCGGLIVDQCLLLRAGALTGAGQRRNRSAAGRVQP